MLFDFGFKTHLRNSRDSDCLRYHCGCMTVMKNNGIFKSIAIHLLCEACKEKEDDKMQLLSEIH